MVRDLHPVPVDLKLIGSPELWQRSESVHDARDRELQEIDARVARTLELLREHRPALRCLGAPQLGIPIRLCRVLLTGTCEPLALVNPWVVEASLETSAIWEECASIPDLRFELDRFSRVTVEYVDLGGSGRTLVAEGEDAAILQHAIDHFNGFLLTDRLNDSRRIDHRLRSHAEMAVADDARAVG